MQSIITFLGLFIVAVVISFIPVISMLVIVIWIIELVLWIVLIIKAYQGEKFKLPVVGDLAESYA
jgi:uncharacterized membrane protein